MAWIASTLVAIAAAVSCSGERATLGLEEPIRVRATFKEGPLPGASPTTLDGGPAALPTVTAYESASTVVRPGQAGKVLSGRTTPGAVAVAVRFADLGSGYWVLPVGGPDPQNGGELVWQADADFGIGLPPGLHPLRVVAIDALGNAGTQRDLGLCVTAAIADNLNACNPTRNPPAAVISLSWDVPADLDLVVVGPSGRVIDAKHPRTEADAGADAGDAGAAVGVIDRDSNAGCRADGLARESLVFQRAPATGSYFVYVNLFDACGKGPAHFRASLVEAQLRADGVTQVPVETLVRTGTLLPAEANGGARLGTFVFEIPFP
ncbi:MAG: hypothetical protein HOO96_34070 [Polyangiaceae bacterium]|nr:hypothetical protein [Polyangiaceae bacterium]